MSCQCQWASPQGKKIYAEENKKVEKNNLCRDNGHRLRREQAFLTEGSRGSASPSAPRAPPFPGRSDRRKTGLEIRNPVEVRVGNNTQIMFVSRCDHHLANNVFFRNNANTTS